MTRFLLVRHGQSEWNAQGRWQGQADPPLSDAGRQEARLAAAALEDFEGPVFSSPLLRAKQTAEIIAAEISEGTVFLEPDLREIDVGDFSGLTNDEIEERLPDAWARLRSGDLATFPSGESREHFRERVVATLVAIASRHPDEDAFVVSHGGAIGALERHLGVHPGVGVGNLEGRWFSVSAGDGAIEVLGERTNLKDKVT